MFEPLWDRLEQNHMLYILMPSLASLRGHVVAAKAIFPSAGKESGRKNTIFCTAISAKETSPSALGEIMGKIKAKGVSP